MCTLSFLRLPGAYSLMMNRDESPLRPKPEEIRQANLEGPDGKARRVLYPVDPRSGGSWVGTNDAGLTLGIMNQFPAGYAFKEGALSRGRLIPEALKAGTAIHALERIAALDLKDTPPFLLLAVDEDSAPLSLRWDGSHLERRLYADGALELGSSGFKPEQVLPGREAQFDLALKTVEGKDAAEVLAMQEAYHFSEEPGPGPYAVWMTRSEARTLSLSHVLVQPKRILLRYWDREASEAGEGPVELRLNR